MRFNHHDRITRLRGTFEENDVGSLLVTTPANVGYLSGFTGEGVLLVRPEEIVLCTDGRYLGEAKEAAENVAMAVINHPRGHLPGAIDSLKETAEGRIAFEADTLTFQRYQAVCDELGKERLIPTRMMVEKLRLIKGDDEITLMREIAASVDEVLTDFLQDLQPGISEREMALELERRLFQYELTKSFSIIAASGPSSAKPHAVPGNRRLARGEMLKIDMGGQRDGYNSDITRTVFCGPPDSRFEEIFNLVQQAQRTAWEAVRPGVACKQLDSMAREIIAAGGHGERFGHGLGHGVGMSVHEAPTVSTRSEDILQPGMVITIEPGIYIPDWGGVRIEDMVVVTEDGHECLTQSPISMTM